MKYLTICASVLSLGMLAAQDAAAADRYCPPNPTRTVKGNVIVKGEKPCQLSVKVKGNVEVKYGAVLEAKEARILGNVQAEGAKQVVLEDTYVRGDVQLKYLEGTDMHESEVSDSKIRGNVQLEGNKTPIEVDDNKISGDLQAYENYDMLNINMNKIRGNLEVYKNYDMVNIDQNKVKGNLQVYENMSEEDNQTNITNNRVKGNLQCYDNYPEPNVENNMVKGDKEGQCMEMY